MSRRRPVRFARRRDEGSWQEDPLSGVANLFDISLAFIVAMVVALFSMMGAPSLFDPNSSWTMTRTAADGRMEIVRKDGKLYLALNRSDSIPTPSGVWLGTTLADAKKIYGGLQTQDLARGTSKAFLIQTLSGGGILFEIGPGDKVISKAAADAAYLRNTYSAGTDYC